jgi:hypothetical protein
VDTWDNHEAIKWRWKQERGNEKREIGNGYYFRNRKWSPSLHMLACNNNITCRTAQSPMNHVLIDAQFFSIFYFSKPL